MTRLILWLRYVISAPFMISSIYWLFFCRAGGETPTTGSSSLGRGGGEKRLSVLRMAGRSIVSPCFSDFAGLLREGRGRSLLMVDTFPLICRVSLSILKIIIQTQLTPVPTTPVYDHVFIS